MLGRRESEPEIEPHNDGATAGDYISDRMRASMADGSADYFLGAITAADPIQYLDVRPGEDPSDALKREFGLPDRPPDGKPEGGN